jgi:cytochrome P450 / NADPH-cytochrome P450 reductase
MQDIASQMVLKWARFGPDTPINVAEDFTRLTLDTIALYAALSMVELWIVINHGRCAMGHRFNSFYHDSQHPFIQAMGGVLSVSFARSRRPPLVCDALPIQNHHYGADIAALEAITMQLLDKRRAHPTVKKDLLNTMISNKDHQTGEQLSHDAIVRNMITFLIAGETSSNLSYQCHLGIFLQMPGRYRDMILASLDKELI